MQSESEERKQGESHSSSVTPDLASDKPVGNDLEGSRYYTGFFRRTTQLLSRYGIETHGIAPVPAEERLETRWYQMFFVWFSANMNILTFSTGTAGPAYFSLGVHDSLIIIVIVDLAVCLLPAFFAVFGPKLGTRAMVQARFSWGYFGAIIPTVLNVFSMQGFLILNCIVGGQTLASLSSRLNDTLGIVIIGIITLVVTFCGYRIIHWYESIAWIPNVVAFITMLGVGYPQLRDNQSAPVSEATVAEVISFASILASSVLSWCTMTPDYGVYHSPAASSARIFLYTYLAFFTASVTAHTLGAAFAAAAPNVPAWNEGFSDSSSVGGLLYSVLLPTGAFGKILTALVALSIPSACAPTMYTFSNSLMAVAPWFAAVPRWVYILISEGILIPVAIVGAKKFYTTFVDILNIIGYWSSVFAAIILTEHVLFRRASFSEDQYPITTWASYTLLPSGIPAVVAFACACGALVPFMSQAWYVGPVARHGSGDVGVFVGFVVGAITYALARGFENCGTRR
ncbi:permease for cytosine/purines, uracil, thiamine, allantoin-domain-containing protein [Suillus subaureus]|uniref:Permease for cytosine/purines, uracil, thiamine, allantoin-domain-containing protein n=1 Tax=Suillus subaureus TaxID=48587 RepID=A0A9P7JD03_9AGAM|nr:permease for cytosine/purines, uracil, thiamine, allantoin-domain-containing protein [Suillus subaureus]KAG1815189.1 permease for cytosine/purines, uracil, thiamine, allantoin-domain-containing protein [Suillus subaureus]